MKQLLAVSVLVLAASTGLAAEKSALSLPGYFGSINNNSGYVIECSQVMGGYCANNPMPANGYIQMLPDPGSNVIQGHVMVFDKQVPDHYVDSILFAYEKQKSGRWKFRMLSQYKTVKVQMISDDTVLLSKGAKQ
jgi:hypothetical protein